MALNEKAWIRVLNGAFVVLVDFMSVNEVAVSVNNQLRVMDRDVWRALPVYRG